MKNKLFKSIIHFILAGIVLLFFTVSLGAITENSSPELKNTFRSPENCQLSTDPNSCYYQQTQQKWSSINLPPLPALSTQQIGWDGPFNAELKYDSYLSWILGLNYIQIFKDRIGLAAKLTGGINEFRANLTTAYAFNQDQQFKFTYEYLRQNLPFDFITGSISTWVSQYSLGMGYQQVFRHAIVRNLEFNAYITRAGNKDLSYVVFNQQTIIPSVDYTYDVNYRNIAGGNENTGMFSANLFPLANQKTALTLGAGYSSVDYDTQYENVGHAKNNGIAYTAELTQLISPKCKFMASVNSTAALKEYAAELKYILFKDIEGGLTGQYIAGKAGMRDSSSVVLTLTYPAPDSYKLDDFSNVQLFKNWLEKPIVYSARVLAIKDEKVESYEYKSSNIIFDQIKLLGQQFDSVAMKDYFYVSSPSAQVNYRVYAKKIAVDESSADNATDNRDYINELNLRLASAGQKHAILQSADSTGFPSLDRDGKSMVGIYQIIIVATVVDHGVTRVLRKEFKLTLNPNILPENDIVSWTDIKTLPAATLGIAYSQNLNTLGLLEIKDADGNLLSDNQYDFTVVSASDNNWMLKPGSTDILVSKEPIQLKGEVTLVLSAVHRASGKSPVNGDHPPNIEKTFTLMVIGSSENPTLNWTGTSVLSTEGVTGEVYSADLNIAGLLETKNNGKIMADAYNFEIDPVSQAAGWFIESNGTSKSVLKHNTLPAAGSVDIVLSVSSALYTEIKATQGNQSDPSQQSITITINPNTRTTLNWTGVSALPTSGMVGISYSVDLNSLDLLETKENGKVVVDSYNFEIDEASKGAGWSIASNGQTNSVLKHDALSTAGSVNIILSASSTLDKAITATNGNQSDVSKQSVTLNVNPPLWRSLTTAPLRFDLTGKPEAGHIGSVSEGASLNNLVQPSNEMSNLTFKWGGDGVAPAYWRIVQENNHYYLLRDTDPTGTKISARGVGTQVALPKTILACYDLKNASQNCIPAVALNVPLRSDPNLHYVYAENDSLVRSLATSTVSRLGDPKVAQAAPKLRMTFDASANTKICTTEKCEITIVGDSDKNDETNSNIKINAGENAPVTITKISEVTTQVIFITPSYDANTFGRKNTRPYLTAESPAGGNQPKAIEGLPATIVDSLILVPNNKPFNTSYNTQPVMGDTFFGITNTRESCAMAHAQVTGLYVKLPELKGPLAGKHYQLTSYQIHNPGADFTYSFICPNSGPNSSDTRPTWSNYPGSANRSCLAGNSGKTFSYDGLFNVKSGAPYCRNGKGAALPAKGSNLVINGVAVNEFTLFVAGNQMSDGVNYYASSPLVGNAGNMPAYYPPRNIGISSHVQNGPDLGRGGVRSEATGLGGVFQNYADFPINKIH